MEYAEALDKIIEEIVKSLGSRKELSGMFEDLPGEIEDVILEQLYQNVRYVVLERLINTTAVQSMDNKEIADFVGEITLFVSMNIAHSFVTKLVEAANKNKDKDPDMPIGYA